MVIRDGQPRGSHRSALKRYGCSVGEYIKRANAQIGFDSDFGNNLMINFMAAMVL